MTQSLTLAEYAQHQKDPAVKMLVNDVLKDSRSLFDLVPFTDVDTLTTRTQVHRGVSEPSFRPIGQENYDDFDTGGVEDKFFNVYDLGGRHTVDKIRLMDKNQVRDPREFEMARAKEGTIRKFNKQFILGTSNDAEGFPGLNDWLVEADTNQDQDFTSAPVFAAGGVDTFIDNLHAMFDEVGTDRMPDVILCNRYAQLKINSALRRSNYLSEDKDQYERRITSFMGVPIIDVGSKTGEKTTSDYIIPLENTDQTYLYFVKFGPEFVEGLQMEPLTIEDIGFTEASDKTVYKIILHWIIGLSVNHRWSLARGKFDFGS